MANPFTGDLLVTETDLHEDSGPLQFFSRFFPKDLFSLIADQTNRYSVEKTGSSVGTNPKEIEQFIGITLLLGVVKIPRYRMAWSPNTSQKDPVGHFGVFGETRARCNLCGSGRTDVMCCKCAVHLCFVRGRNCFHEYHKA